MSFHASLFHSIHQLRQCLRSRRVVRQSKVSGEVAAIGCAEDKSEHQPCSHKHSGRGGGGQLVRKVLTKEDPHHVLIHHSEAADFLREEFNEDDLK